MSDRLDSGGAGRGPESRLLTDPQRAHLESILRYIEGALDDAERELDAEPGSGILRGFRNDLGARERARLREGIANARDLIGTIADRFGLGADARDVRRSIVSRFSLLAIDAGSASSQGLRSYGPVEEKLHDALDPLITGLASELDAAVRNASGEPRIGGRRAG